MWIIWMNCRKPKSCQLLWLPHGLRADLLILVLLCLKHHFLLQILIIVTLSDRGVHVLQFLVARAIHK